MKIDRNIMVAPSLLSADFANMGQAVQLIEAADGDILHLDVMDGAFVPRITFGSKMVADMRQLTSKPLDVHLMIEKPENHIKTFFEAGSDIITFHLEATVHVHRLLEYIRSLGIKAGISITPSTPVSALTELFTEVDIILVMTVNPGFGGQKLIPKCLDKVRTLQQIRKQGSYSFKISVDGGINKDTASEARGSGADILVAGSAFFSAQNKEEFVSTLRGKKIV